MDCSPRDIANKNGWIVHHETYTCSPSRIDNSHNGDNYDVMMMMMMVMMLMMMMMVMMMVMIMVVAAMMDSRILNWE